MPVGTIINAIAVIVGGLIGLIFHEKMPNKIKTIVFQGIGLTVIIIGLKMALEVDNFVLLIFSIVIGGIIGEIIDLENFFMKLSDKLKKIIKTDKSEFKEGLITASIFFCVGSMAIIGSINEGINSDHSILLTKSIIDGFTAIALSATYGIGVIFSAIPILIYQSTITLLATEFQYLFSGIIINQITVTGGILILSIGLNCMGYKKIRVTNLLPALIVNILLTIILY